MATDTAGAIPLKQTIFPEATIVRLPPGTLERVREAAEQSGTTSAELMRQAIRRAVEKSAPSASPQHNG
jgi:predicted transcriptional regulator